MIYIPHFSLRSLMAGLSVIAALALSACASGPETTADSETSTGGVSSTSAPPPASAKLVASLSDKGKQLCVFDAASQIKQRYEVTSYIQLQNVWGYGSARFLPNLADDAVAKNADAVINYNTVLDRTLFGMPKPLLTARTIKWHQPTGKSCAEIGGITMETMLLTNRTSSGKPVFPFRARGAFGVFGEFGYGPLYESGVITLALPGKSTAAATPALTRAAVLKAAESRKWQVQKEEAGRVQLKLIGDKDDTFITVDVLYDASTYETKFVDGAGLRHDAQNGFIGLTANRWMRDLEAQIKKNYGRS